MTRTRTLLFLLALPVAAGCARDVAAPDDQTLLGAASPVVTSEVLEFVNRGGPGIPPGLHRLPENLKLSADQLAKLQQLVQRFHNAHRSDLQVLEAVRKAVDEAIKAGKTREEVRGLRERGAAAARRIAASAEGLHKAILDLLTREQRAFLEANQPRRVCDAPPLSDAQRTQIRQLTETFAAANRADLERLAQAGRDVAEAVKAGKTREEVGAILEAVRPIRERMAAAHRKLTADIQALLTPEQRASKCLRLGRGALGARMPALRARGAHRPGMQARAELRRADRFQRHPGAIPR